MHKLDTPKEPRWVQEPLDRPTVDCEPARREASEKIDVPKILESLLVEEISIDGMCGIY